MKLVRHRGLPETAGKMNYAPVSGILILAVVSIFLAATIGKIVVRDLAGGRSSSALVLEWKRYSPDGSQLSLKLPGEPHAEGFEIPDSMRGLVRQVRLYKYSEKGLQVAVWDTSYVDEKTNDVQQAADGLVRGLKDLDGVTKYEETITPVTRSGLSGLSISARFRRDGRMTELEAVLVGEQGKLWQVILTHPALDQYMHVASERVLNSIEIDHKQAGQPASACL